MNLYKEWGTMIGVVFADHPHELGPAKLLSLKIENEDLNIPIPNDWDKNNATSGIYIMVAVQLKKLNSIMQELLKGLQ